MELGNGVPVVTPHIHLSPLRFLRMSASQSIPAVSTSRGSSRIRSQHHGPLSWACRSPTTLVSAAAVVALSAATMILLGKPSARLSHSSDTITSKEVSQFNEKDSLQKYPLVSAQWLFDHLNDHNLKVLDASWYMPAEQRNPLQEYQKSHIPGALFFDIDAIADTLSNLPHMLPSESAFAAAVSALGIQNADNVVIYDGKGIFSAARAWWMFRAFGHEKVWVLDGGLPEWKSSGYQLDATLPEALGTLEKIHESSNAVKAVNAGQQVATSFKASFQHHLVWSLDEVKKNLEEKKYQHVDARSKPRFDGVAPEPRKGIRSGHIPGSKCVPFSEVLSTEGKLLAPTELSTKFKDAGIALDSPVVSSCGTGVTACVLALALHCIGVEDVAVYDGSWTEWGSRTDTPVETSQ